MQGPPRQQVKMNVPDGLAAVTVAVRHHSETRFGEIEAIGQERGDVQNVIPQAGIGLANFQDCRNVAPWNNQEVLGGLGCNVPDDEDALVFVDNIGPGLPGGDSAEDTAVTQR